MALSDVDDSQRRAARAAGLTYLLSTAAVVYANYGIHERLVEGAQRAQAARNIAASEQLFRLGIACDLVYCVGGVAFLVALYVILRAVNRNLALLAMLGRLVYSLMWLLMTLDLLKALRLATGASSLHVMETEQVQALVALSLSARGDEYYVGLLFWGLASTICSYLWLQSRYIPRALAAFGLVSSLIAVASSLALFVIPHFATIVNPYWYDSPIGVFEMVTSFWLLFRGLRPSGTALPGLGR